MASTTEVKRPPKEYKLQWIRGVPFGNWFNKEYIEQICDLEPGDDDLLIATYPKTGTTWMQYIVLQILSKGKSLPSFHEAHEKACPFLELTGTKVLNTITAKPRVYKHHLSFNLVRKNPKSKVIYVYRRPEDTCISYFHFLSSLNVLVELNKFFEDFINGTVSYGNYFDHIMSFIEHKDRGNMLLVSYEKLQMHRKEEILRIANFIGKEYYDALKKDESILDKIIKHTSFDYMKENLSVKFPTNLDDVFDKNNPGVSNLEKSGNTSLAPINFFRKGIIGDGKKSLSESQLSRLMDLAKQKLKGTFVLEEWFQEETCF